MKIVTCMHTVSEHFTGQNASNYSNYFDNLFKSQLVVAVFIWALFLKKKKKIDNCNIQ